MFRRKIVEVQSETKKTLQDKDEQEQGGKWKNIANEKRTSENKGYGVIAAHTGGRHNDEGNKQIILKEFHVNFTKNPYKLYK